MRNIHELTPEEIKNLVSFNIGDITIYYSNISTIGSDYFLYNNNKIYEQDIEVDDFNKLLEDIRKGKEQYEVFILLNNKNKIQEVVDNIIQEQLKKLVQESVDEIKHNHDRLVGSLDTISNNIIKAHNKTLDNVLGTCDTIIENMGKTQGKINDTWGKLEDVTKYNKDIKKLIDNTETQTKEFNNVINSLKKLFGDYDYDYDYSK
jgi:chromosome segregation ATPase